MRKRQPWLGAGTVLPLLAAIACGGQHAREAGATDAAMDDEAPAAVETRWTTRSELFMEYPPLVEGGSSRFAIHFTDLATFEPVRAGRAAVRLTGARDQEFTVDSPGPRASSASTSSRRRPAVTSWK